jgi:hypothetical protein
MFQIPEGWMGFVTIRETQKGTILKTKKNIPYNYEHPGAHARGIAEGRYIFYKVPNVIRVPFH